MLSETLKDYVSAAFSGLWVETHEHDEAQAEIYRLCQAEEWTFATWDLIGGLTIDNQPQPDTDDPAAVIGSLPTLATEGKPALLCLPDFHRLIDNPEMVCVLRRAIAQGKTTGAHVVVLSPVVQIPVELQKLFVVIEHDLPNREQLETIAREIATEDGEIPEDAGQFGAILDAAAGLTRYEAEGAFSLSLVRHSRLTPSALWELKTGLLKKSGLLTLHRGGETFDDLGGLDSLKTFCGHVLRPDGNRTAQPRGVLMLGVPGTGKSAFAKALGNETGRPTLCLDVGALMGSLVGETEGNIRQALRIADAMAPCVLFVDEIEKALSGSGGNHDSGVARRLFGTLLTWLADHESDVFFVGTCNDVSALPPEFSRAERFDAIYFLDLPGAEQKEAIWSIYEAAYQVTGDRPDDTDWTGAEIKACCRLASLLDVSLVDAARNVVPIATTAAEGIENLRQWASGRCLSADHPGTYTRTAGDRPRRAVSRPTTRPSAN